LALIHELQVHQIELEMQNEELRRAQAEANELREKYQDLYDFAPVGYVTLDERGVILAANLADASLLGVVRRALLKRPLARFFAEGSSSEFERFRRLLLADGASRVQCEVQLHADGKKGDWLLLQGEAVHIGVEGAKTLRVAIIDITERKRAVEEVKRLNAALEESNRELEAFGYTVTHDLRRPLTRIYSAAQLLVELYGSADEECLQVVSTISDGCREMDALIDAIFNLAHPNTVSLKRQPTDLSRKALDIAAGLKLRIRRGRRTSSFRNV
jgi:PAS domain S-box-containing protein